MDEKAAPMVTPVAPEPRSCAWFARALFAFCCVGAIFAPGALIDLSFVTDDAYPSACIIMPTNSRPEFVVHALGMIRRQEYPIENLQVVIVDDSPAELRVPSLAAGRQVRDSLAINYVVSDERQSVGAKRNVAVAQCTAAATAVVHWDDDDFYGAQRLQKQLAPLARGVADATVLQHTHTYFVERDELYAARAQAASGCAPPGCGMTARPDHGPHFGTLAYRRALHSPEQAVAFPDTSEAEDYAFAQRAVQRLGATLQVVATHARPAEPLFVCVRHGSNTWAWADGTASKFDGELHAVKLASTALHGADAAFAARMRAEGVVPAALSLRRAARPAINKFPAADVDTTFFDHLYAGARSSTERDAWEAAWRAAGGRPRANNATISYFEMGNQWGYPAWDSCVDVCQRAHPYPSQFDCEGECKGEWKFATYDLQTRATLDASFVGGLLGAAPTPLAAHGGVFVAAAASGAAQDGPATLTLSKDLELAYYTSLTVRGDLDAAGHSINVSSFATLVVTGEVKNALNVSLGAFSTLATGGPLAASGAVLLTGGGRCAGFICDNHSFALPPGPATDDYWENLNYSALTVGGSATVGTLRFSGCCQNVSVHGDVSVTDSYKSYNGPVSLELYQLQLLNASGKVSLLKGGLQIQNGYYDWHAGSAGTWPVGLKAGGDVSVGGHLGMWQGALEAGGELFVSGDLQASGLGIYDGVNGRNFAVAKLTVGGTFGCYRCYDFALSGVLRAGNLSLDDATLSLAEGVQVAGTISLNTGSALSTTSLTAGTLDGSAPDSRIGVFSMDVGALILGSSTLLEAQGSELRAGRLRLLSASKLSTFGAPLVVTRRIEVAPHALFRCGGYDDFYAAGSGTLGVPPTPVIQPVEKALLTPSSCSRNLFARQGSQVIGRASSGSGARV